MRYPSAGLPLALALLIAAPLALAAQHAVTDGPYVTWHGDTAATVRAVCRDSVRMVTVRPVQGTLRITPPCTSAGRVVTLTARAPAAEPATFTGARRIFATSDVEGAYEPFVALLQAAGIIDRGRGWAWGDGHLVLVGDLVDRGSQVTEVLWLVHRLEQEARRAGGRVHYVLGNHDAMLLYGDHRYVAPKYQLAAERLGAPLLDLYGPDTELGRWMRSKPVMLRIDSVLFTHAGIAPSFAAAAGEIDSVNAVARATLYEPARRKADSSAARVFGAEGPLWYRGYFGKSSGRGSSPPWPTAATIAEALARYGGSTVVVGHTVVDSITSMHDGRVIAIDVTFKDPARVEGLLIEEGKFYRVGVNGSRTPMR